MPSGEIEVNASEDVDVRRVILQSDAAHAYRKNPPSILPLTRLRSHASSVGNSHPDATLVRAGSFNFRLVEMLAKKRKLQSLDWGA